MTKYFYTILTAALNSEGKIENTLLSLSNQQFRKFEHIVIDGDSRDGTISILERYKSLYALRYISEPDKGIADALNKGLKIAQGKYILVLHADDRLISHQTLQYVHSFLAAEKYDILSFPVLIDDSVGSTIPIKPFPLHWWYHFKTIIPHQGAFIHHRVYEKIGGYRTDLSIALDYDFFYRAFKEGFSVSIKNEFVAVMGGFGISSNKDLLKKRLDEEAFVHKMNENNRMWRMAQIIFQFLYVPYKTKLLPKVKGER